MAEKFCLKWNDFQTNVSNAFKKLRKTENFYDVTLVSDDQQQISAHKVVLASSSEYFKNILTSNTHSHPMLCLSGVNAGDIKNMLDFMYNGEIQIFQDDLDQFLEIAQRFHLEGLIQNKQENYTDTQEFKYEASQESANIMDLVPESENEPINHQTKEKIISLVANYESIEELDQKIEEMFEKVEGDNQKRRCIPCGKISSMVANARNHAETHIDGLNFPCQYCDKSFRSRHILREHIRRYCLKK